MAKNILMVFILAALVHENVSEMPFAADNWLYRLRICEKKDSVPLSVQRLPVVSDHHSYGVCLFSELDLTNSDRTFNLKKLEDFVRFSFGQAKKEHPKILQAFKDCANTVSAKAKVDKELELTHGLYECLRGMNDIRPLLGLSA